MRANPAVSVMMPVYNGERYLREAVESILRQTFEDFEFVVVDNGSIDSSPAILQEYAEADCRVVLESCEQAGVANAMNAGLQRCRAQLVAIMNADDVARPDRIERQLVYLQAHPLVVVVGTSHLDIDADGDPIAVMHREPDPVRLRETMIRGGGVGICQPTVMMRMQAVQAVGGYRTTFKTSEDRDLWLRLLTQGVLANIDDDLLKYRRHLDSLSNTADPTRAECRIEMMQQAAASIPIPDEYVEAFVRRQRAGINNGVRRMPSDYYRDWCGRALGSGFTTTARKYAWRHLYERPLALISWRLFIRSLISQRWIDRLRTCE